MSELTPQEMRDQVDAIWSALNARDFDALGELLDREVRFHSVVAAAEGEVYVGIAGLRKWADNVDATWEGFHTEAIEFHEAGPNQAVVVSHLTGKAKASGVPLDVRTGHVLTWRNGKGWLHVAYTDPREAFAAVGLKTSGEARPPV